jgi:DNA-binding MarR family transcriptional regulator
MHLARRERLPSQKELAEHVNITPAAVTATLKKLEQGGYIERSVGNDNRYNEIAITSLGKKVVEETKMMFTDIDTHLFESLTNEEIKGLISCFEKIQDNINKKMKEISSV